MNLHGLMLRGRFQLVIAGASLATASSVRSHLPASATIVDLSMATLHAAVLSSARNAADSIDRPYVLVSVAGPGKKSAVAAVPAAGQMQVHRDQAIGTHSLTSVALNDGDTVRVLISALEGGTATTAAESNASAAAARALVAGKPADMRVVSAALAPLTNDGAHWLGSATLLITRDAGTVYWRGLECVATCKVVSGSASTALSARDGAASAGVIELSGAGATYHMKIEARAAH